MTTALASLRRAYEGPAEVAAAARRRGTRVVGIVGADVPRELVEAAGMLPLRLRGEGPSSELANAILGPGVPPTTRRILADVLEARTPVDHLLLCHDRESTTRLYTSLRALAPAEPGRRLPGLWFLDLLHLPTATTAAYDREEVALLAGALGRWAGSPLEEGPLREAIARGNRTRELLRAVSMLRRGDRPRLSGVDALAVAGATQVLDSGTANRLLEELLAEPPPPLPPPVRRIYLTGSTADAALVEAIERDGSLVVGEDHDLGEALADGVVDEAAAPLDALAARYGQGCVLARRTDTEARAAHAAAEAAAAGADVVLAVVDGGEDVLLWGLPPLERRLAGQPRLATLRRPDGAAPSARELEAVL